MKDTLGTSFEMDYTLFTNAGGGNAAQFGMDFTLTQKNGYPLCQLILPAVGVGTNIAGVWNIDNHTAAANIESLLFNNASTGTIVD